MALRRWIIIGAALACVLPAYSQERPKPPAVPLASQAATSPLTLIYRIAGLRDDGDGPGAGLATTISCSLFSKVAEKISFDIRDWSGAQKFNGTFDISAPTAPAKSRNYTVVTHINSSIAHDTSLNTGDLRQGTAYVYSTTTNIACSAFILDASAKAQGIGLHLQRFNPISGTQE